MKKFSSYSFGEARTGIGQLIKFSAPNEGKAFRIIKAVIRRYIRSIDIYATKEIKNMTHGSFGRYTRYDITQHDYAGGRGGYIEVLSIADPPEERNPYVIHDHRANGQSSFSEWESLEAARAAWSHYWRNTQEIKLEKQPGFKRLITCGLLTPWFYAVGDESLVGDYAFPDGLQDDPVFIVGKKFVVTDYEGRVSIKICMGCRFLNYSEKGGNWDRYRERQVIKRVVYWDDGSTWSDLPGNKSEREPKPLRDDELWIVEAMEQFRELLSGHSTSFSLSLTDGTSFHGRISPNKTRGHTEPGEYLAIVTIKGEKKPRHGTVEFTPTEEYPDVVSFIRGKLKLAPGATIARIEVKRDDKSGDTKKWQGVFFERRPKEE